MCEQKFMQAAIDKARAGVDAGQSPFGAVIVRNGKLISAAHNTVWLDSDPTAHAEVNAIRLAGEALKSIDFSGCHMYTTCEPCPMCLTAIHWAKIDRVYYGATIADAASAGFTELQVPARKLAQMGGSSLSVEAGPLSQECKQLFEYWKTRPRPRAY